LWGVSLLISLLALIGVAPFSIFMSEYQLLRAATGAGAWVTLVLFLAASGVVFVSALRHMIDMVFGSPTPHHKGGRDGKLAVPIVTAASGLGGARRVDAAAALRCHRQRGGGTGGPAVTHFARTRNAVPVRADAVPQVDIERFRRLVLQAIDAGGRLLLLTGLSQKAGETRLLAAIADDTHGEIALTSTIVGRSISGVDAELPRGTPFRARNP
jgi:hypothetical protein